MINKKFYSIFIILSLFIICCNHLKKNDNTPYNLEIPLETLTNETLWGLNSRLKQENIQLIGENDVLKNQNRRLIIENNILWKNWRPEITSLKVGNGNFRFGWISDPNTPLSARQMREFAPVITYNSLKTERVLIYYKILDSNNELLRIQSSPAGYSYLWGGEIRKGTNQTQRLSGFGDYNKSIFHPGIYTVEIWFNNKLIKNENIHIGS